MPRLSKDWVYVDTFTAQTDVDNFILSQNVSKKDSSELKDGTKILYHCTNKKKFNCSFSVYVFCPDNTSSFLAYSAGQHDHTLPEDLAAKEAARVQVSKCVSQKLGAGDIRRILKSQNLPVPENSRALYNMISVDRNNLGCSDSTVASLAQCCVSHSLEASRSDHDLFVTEYEIMEESKCFVFMASKHLLSNACQSDLLQVDATYILIWNQFPVQAVGTTDKNRKFHPFAIAITWNESTDSYERLFRALRNALAVTNLCSDYKPVFVLSDGAKSITAAITRVWPDASRLMCWAHCMRRLYEHRNRLPTKPAWYQVEAQIKDLQLCPTSEMFSIVAPHLIQSWESQGFTEFASYFSSTYGPGSDLQGWYEGAASTHPSTNNGLESLNKTIKKHFTFRKAMCLGEFQTTCEDMISDFSRASLKHGFQLRPTVKDEEKTRRLTAGYQFATNPSAVVIEHPDPLSDASVYLIPTQKCCTDAVGFFAPLYHPMYFNSFAEYQNWLNCYFVVENYRGFFCCSCPNGVKKLICEHTIGVQIRHHGLEVPDTAKAVPVGRVRGPGRPKKVGLALSYT